MNHALEDCHLLRWKPYQERIKFLASKRLCFGCLSDKHVARFCPERKACKFPNCTRKHPTVLHTSSNRDKCSVDVGVGTENSTEAPVLNGMANTDKCLNGLNQEVRRRTAMLLFLSRSARRKTTSRLSPTHFWTMEAVLPSVPNR